MDSSAKSEMCKNYCIRNTQNDWEQFWKACPKKTSLHAISWYFLHLTLLIMVLRTSSRARNLSDGKCFLRPLDYFCTKGWWYNAHNYGSRGQLVQLPFCFHAVSIFPHGSTIPFTFWDVHQKRPDLQNSEFLLDQRPSSVIDHPTFESFWHNHGRAKGSNTYKLVESKKKVGMMCSTWYSLARLSNKLFCVYNCLLASTLLLVPSDQQFPKQLVMPLRFRRRFAQDCKKNENSDAMLPNEDSRWKNLLQHRRWTKTWTTWQWFIPFFIGSYPSQLEQNLAHQSHCV